MRLEQRLAAIEAKRPAGDWVAAEKFRDDLLGFLKTAFPEDPRHSRMDDLARLCGLPSARYMKSVLDDKFSEAALQAAAQHAYGDDWREPMKATMDRALDQIAEVLGDGGLEKAAKGFPPALIEARMTSGQPADAG